MESFLCTEFNVRTIAKIYVVFTQTGKVSSQPGFFVPTLDLNHITILSPVRSKTDFRQLARTPRDFLHETCLIGVPSIEMGQLRES